MGGILARVRATRTPAAARDCRQLIAAVEPMEHRALRCALKPAVRIAGRRVARQLRPAAGLRSVVSTVASYECAF
jgi:hypothetical protein